jgi:hypothetical protein
LGSPAAEQLKSCDETANLPELWRIFNVHYLAAVNFTGLFSLFHQLSGPSFVQKNLLTEFVRQNDLQKRIVQLKTQPNSNFTGTPVKSFFNSPFLRRSLSMSSTPKKSKSTAKAINPSESEEGGDDSSLPDLESPAKQTDKEVETPRLLEGEDEWRRVMTSLFNMTNPLVIWVGPLVLEPTRPQLSCPTKLPVP